MTPTLTIRWRSRTTKWISARAATPETAGHLAAELTRDSDVEWIEVDDGTQVCATCGERKRRRLDFYVHPGARNGSHYECRSCYDERRARNRQLQGRAS